MNENLIPKHLSQKERFFLEDRSTDLNWAALYACIVTGKTPETVLVESGLLLKKEKKDDIENEMR